MLIVFIYVVYKEVSIGITSHLAVCVFICGGLYMKLCMHVWCIYMYACIFYVCTYLNFSNCGHILIYYVCKEGRGLSDYVYRCI